MCIYICTIYNHIHSVDYKCINTKNSPFIIIFNLYPNHIHTNNTIIIFIIITFLYPIHIDIK